MQMRIALLGILLALVGGACAHLDESEASANVGDAGSVTEDGEVVLLPAQIPEAVVAAAVRVVPGLVVEEAEMEQERSGTVYCVHGTANGTFYEIEVLTDGTVLEVEEGDEHDDDDDDHDGDHDHDHDDGHDHDHDHDH